MIIKATGNPIIRRRGVCDPHVHIFNDRAYLYASHDCTGDMALSDGFKMVDWEIWSSSDLVTWRLESSVKPETFGMGPSVDCWAVDAAQKDGMFYLYVSNGTKETWVLRSSNPGKGFTEPLGRPLLPEGLTPTRSYDPAVFTDDDGQSYIIFGTPVWAGGDSYYIAQLGEDMISLAEEPRKIQLDDIADDKPFIHKHNGVYYLTWASYYATSRSVYGPYVTQGNIGLSQDHGSFFKWRNQWFKAFTVDESISSIRRATGIAYIHYTADGAMRADQLIREYGVGQYDGRWSVIEAEWYMAGGGIEKRQNTFNSFDVVMRAGSWVEYPHIHHLPDMPHMVINAMSEADVDLQVWEGDTLLGTIHKPASYLRGGEYTKYSNASVRLDIPAGEHSLRLRALGDIKLNRFHFMAD